MRYEDEPANHSGFDHRNTSLPPLAQPSHTRHARKLVAMRLTILSLVAGWALLLVGCRTIWTHPHASEAKYANDFSHCRTLTQTRWQTCMTNLGWSPRKGSGKRYAKGGTGIVTKTFEEMQAEEPGQRSKPTEPNLVWVNPAVKNTVEYTKALGRDKANCIERGYVGQATRGNSSGRVGGGAVGVVGGFGGSADSSYNSEPLFDKDLFMACMNAGGWTQVQQTKGR
jgi:hypothetical protein